MNEDKKHFIRAPQININEIDKRHVLYDEAFTFRVSKNGKIFVDWFGKQVTILKGKEAQRFISKIEHLNGQEAHLFMAKATGNFKRGNAR